MAKRLPQILRPRRLRLPARSTLSYRAHGLVNAAILKVLDTDSVSGGGPVNYRARSFKGVCICAGPRRAAPTALGALQLIPREEKVELMDRAIENLDAPEKQNFL